MARLIVRLPLSRDLLETASWIFSSCSSHKSQLPRTPLSAPSWWTILSSTPQVKFFSLLQYQAADLKWLPLISLFPTCNSISQKSAGYDGWRKVSCKELIKPLQAERSRHNNEPQEANMTAQHYGGKKHISHVTYNLQLCCFTNSSFELIVETSAYSF